jgi:hypothetical protein
MIEILLTIYIIAATYVMVTICNGYKDTETREKLSNIIPLIFFCYLWPILVVWYILETIKEGKNNV